MDVSSLIPPNKSSDGGIGQADAVVIAALELSQISGHCCAEYGKLLKQYKAYDDATESDGCFLVLPDGVPGKRLVYAPVGPMNRDVDDVRRIRDAVAKGVKRALRAGAKRLVVGLPSAHERLEAYNWFDVVAVLGAYEAIYTPIEIREACPKRSSKVQYMGFCNFASKERTERVYTVAQAIECGRIVARDIGGSDPERMAAPNVAKYVEQVFADSSSVKLRVIDDVDAITRDYPCLAAVNRASVRRHEVRVIFLDYQPEGPVETTLCLVGKGVTYDTGGADIKAGGVMAGMHRDKCGAAAVAGFFKTVETLQPKGVRVLGAMAMVRNSVGSNCYVSDELITTRSGVRIRVGNTDAEGRMAMVDLLCHMKEKVTEDNLPNAHLMTVATLTGHAVLAVGEEYSIAMDNGPARKAGVAQKLQAAGDAIGDPFEISTVRREDYDFNVAKSEYEDILQCNNLPSSRTPRGHQFPAAFMLQVSGLDKHGLDSDRPICYSHIDIAGSSGKFPGLPTGAPIAALTATFLLAK